MVKKIIGILEIMKNGSTSTQKIFITILICGIILYSNENRNVLFLPNSKISNKKKADGNKQRRFYI